MVPKLVTMCYYAWPQIFLIGLTAFTCFQYQDAIERWPSMRDEYIPGAEHRARMYFWGMILSAFLTVVTYGRPESSLFSDIGFTLALGWCWIFSRWFLGTLRQPRRQRSLADR